LAREGTLDSAMNILVTGGGTIAPIDDVRAITNTSTGRFSSAISEAALRRGAKVWHVHTPSAIVPLPAQVSVDLDAERVALRDRLTLLPLAEGTVPEYLATLRSLLVSQPFDAVFLAMAVSDYAPEPIIGKLNSDLDELVIRCKRVPKVIQSARDWAPATYLVGFKLTSGASEAELIDRATEANKVNRTELTVANDLSLYRQGKHTVHLVRPGQPVERLGGMDVAGRLVERVFRWVGERPR
jgi:phosphopantothenoylcysteine synthetase/decarboxylase